MENILGELWMYQTDGPDWSKWVSYLFISLKIEGGKNKKTL